MFYILIISGIIFIILGVTFNGKSGKINENLKEDLYLDEIYNEDIENLSKTIKKNNIKNKNKKTSKEKEDEVELLEMRLEKLEKMLFRQMLEKETNKPIVAEERDKQAAAAEKDSLEKYELIKRYENQNKSLDEISALLEMNKGEVILLKNLYKNS